MKKRFSLLLCCALLLPCLLLFSSCGGDGDGPYTVTFSIDGRKTKVTVEKGEVPVCPEELLSWETAEHYYKVTGWDKEIVPAKSNTTYVATVGEYGLTEYDIRFRLPDGRILKTTAHEGELPTPPEGYETDLTNVDRIGRFDHWSPELVAPTAENTEGRKFVMYQPIYNYETRYYIVTFNVKGTEYKVQAAGNTVPVCPVDPASLEDASNRFFGWDKAIGKATADAVYTAWYGSAAEILPVKDGAKGILTMTYDDGILDTAKWVNAENRKYGLKGSCMLIAGRQTLADQINQWNAIFADGTLEPESHSMTHDVLPADWSSHYANNKGNNIQSKYKYELIDAKKRLETLFPGRTVLCFAPGNNTLSTASFAEDASGKADLNRPLSDGGAQAVANATYYAVRQGRYGMQTLDPAADASEGGWYNLKIQWFRQWSGLNEGKGWIDNAVKGSWLIVMCHAIIGEGASSSGNQDITTDLADQFFSYAGQYVKSGELWSATLGEATKYIRERQSSTAYQRLESGVLYVGVKIDRTTADGKPMAEAVFNYPLTVKSRVPSAWNSVTYELNGRTVTATCYAESDGNKYVNVNVVPGENGAVSDVRVDRAN